MITTHNQLDIERCVYQLLGVLDKDIEQVEANIILLDQLRGLVVLQDHAALKELLDTIRDASKKTQDNQSLRQSLCCRLGVLLDHPAGRITLSLLEERLDPHFKSNITERKETLRRLTANLKKEYMSTQMLLADCARFNQALLRGIFESNQTKTITYTPSGKSKQNAQAVFMNVQL